MQRRLSEAEVMMTALAAHPFLPLLVAGSNRGSITVSDLESRSQLHAFHAFHDLGNQIFDLAVGPSGRYVASGCARGSVRVWDLESGDCRRTLVDRGPVTWAVAWDASGSFVASGAQLPAVRVWNAETGELWHTLAGHSAQVLALASHPAEDLFASGSEDKTVRVWRWSSGEEVRILRAHKAAVSSLASSSSFLVSASQDKTMRLWSWAADGCVRILGGFGGALMRSSLSWRGRLLVALDGDGRMRMWDTMPEDPTKWACVGSLETHTIRGADVEVLASGEVAYSKTAVFVWGV